MRAALNDEAVLGTLEQMIIARRRLDGAARQVRSGLIASIARQLSARMSQAADGEIDLQGAALLRRWCRAAKYSVLGHRKAGAGAAGKPHPRLGRKDRGPPALWLDPTWAEAPRCRRTGTPSGSACRPAPGDSAAAARGHAQARSRIGWAIADSIGARDLPDALRQFEARFQRALLEIGVVHEEEPRVEPGAVILQ